MKTFVFTLLLLSGACLADAEPPSEAGGSSIVEYRLEARPGSAQTRTFQWRDGTKSVELEAPFLTLSDIRSAKVVSAGVNTPGKFSVELRHTKKGAAKLREVADQDRDRDFSIVLDGKIVASESFPPPQKGVYDRGRDIYGPFSKEEATAIVDRINAQIRSGGATDR